ncbi:MAG: 2-amino-4-hydroxy-6-hydroxymethyldihydropteridine diphosphokinase, partial [Planctomycetota bacterium]
SALVGLGSNLGDREGYLRRSLERLASEEGIEVVRVSRFIETEPVGGPPQGPFLNAAAELGTALEPRALLDVLLRVEAELGRVRRGPNEPRTIDLDLLLYDDRIVEEPGLVIPHPRMLGRAFVLEVLAEIAPGRRHPGSGRTVLEHWSELRRLGGTARSPQP